MSQDSINQYKKSIRLQFQNEEQEAGYRENELLRGRSSSVFAFSILCLINLSYWFLEFRAFGVETSIPMYGYLICALIALANALISQLSEKPLAHNIRLLSNAVLSAAIVMLAVSLQKYSGYHAAEMTLLIIWLATLNSVRLIFSSLVNLLVIVAFLITLSISSVSGFWILLVAVILITAAMLGAYISYLLERQRRLLYLHAENSKSMIGRQESWAFALIDLEMALSGITSFKEIIDLLKKYLDPVIHFESYVLTALEGQGPKPVADKMEGALFEDDDDTIWSQDLLNKLTQTRQSTTSAEHEMVKGMFGKEYKKFISYRLDVPVFSDSKLLGIISLRRSNEAFDDLDMIASFSIATQAMMIFKRTIKNAAMVVDHSVPDPIIRKRQQPATQSDATMSSNTQVRKLSTSQNTSMDFTAIGNSADLDNILAPADLVKKIKQNEESAKKTITLLSRENADKMAADKYRTAAVGGESLSILIIEVDGLSKLREQDGDQVAYKVFAAIVKYIFSMVDQSKDILGRYGQNGLSVLMPNVDMNAAEKFAEKIRQYVARARYKTAYGEKSATLSIGVAALTDDTGDYPSMVKRADMALFVAKKNGRNCVKVRL